jgi:uracil-DNA glycosylase
MEIKIEATWKNILQEEFDAPYFASLIDFVKNAYCCGTVYPPKAQIFEAFNRTPFEKTKVVILGQDPYHGANQAHGLCFSVQDGVPHPPSLRNIFVEIKNELGVEVPSSGCLTRWAEQGVLMLNATLTVRESCAGSHQRRGWERFTDRVIEIVSRERENVVFMLWGAYARSKKTLIDSSKHLVLEAAHPSPLSANRGGWFGCGHFTAANDYLLSHGKKTIVW